jgi:EF-hand domain pair
MIRSLTLIAFATSTMAFQPSSSGVPFVRKTALHMSSETLPFYASPTTLATMERTPVQEAAIQIPEQPPSPVAPKKKAVKKGEHKDGVFSPMVLFVKGVLGDELLNKVRGKVISLHSEVIGSFVETAETTFGDAVLRSLFKLADKDSNGTICKDELQFALRSLGFSWLQEKQIEGIFQRADGDGNGSIDIDEWVKEAPKTLRTNLVKLAKKNGGDMGLLA